MLGAMVPGTQELMGVLGLRTERMLGAGPWTGSVLCDDDPWLTWIYNSLEVMEEKEESFSGGLRLPAGLESCEWFSTLLGPMGHELAPGHRCPQERAQENPRPRERMDQSLEG